MKKLTMKRLTIKRLRRHSAAIIRTIMVLTAAGGIMALASSPARAMQEVKVETVAMGDPQVKDDLFAGTEKFAQGATDVTDVNLGPDMLGMVSGRHGGDLARRMNFMVVRSYTYPHAGMYRMADVEAYRQKLKTGNWNCFIHTRESETNESTDICNRPSPDRQGSEMVILTVEPRELTFIHMSGSGSLADLSKLGALGNLGALGALGGHVPPVPPAPPVPPVPSAHPARPRVEPPSPQPAPQN